MIIKSNFYGPIIKLTTLLLVIIVTSCSTRQEKAKERNRPNIILIMSDDQGWGDVGYNGHPHLKTPALDEMAKNGAVFTRFYSASAVCSPTRGSVLTGRQPDRYGICHANCGHMPQEEITLAELVKEKGYATGHFGKWHLGTLTKDTLDANRGGRPKNDAHYSPPWQNGYDECFVTESKVPTWDPMVVPPRSAGDVSGKLTPGGHFGTFYWNGAGKIVTTNLDGDDSRVIMDRVIPFIDKSINDNKPFLSVIWFHTPHLPTLTGEKYKNLYPGLSEDQQHFYGALSAMDEQIGRLRDHLKKSGVSDNTILFFTSDNGPEGKQTKGRTQGLTKGLQGRKRSLLEGGIRVPGIVEWPDRIKKGTIEGFPAFTTDYFPTVASIIGTDISQFNRTYDGVDLMPVLQGKVKSRNKEMIFQLRKQVALMNGNYKIYSDDKGESFNLFNLEEDPSEETNLASEQPDKLESLINMYRLWKQAMEEEIL
ncbi:MAG: sulfatase-like hydrolase/transferase [Cyclobacteriaceae bacterium]